MHYLIAFACYGAHLPGEDSVDIVNRKSNRFGAPFLAPSENLTATVQSTMPEEPYLLDEASRHIVLETIKQVCAHRAWALLAAHIRINHVHAVVEASVPPEQVMHALKSYSTRALKGMGAEPRARYWSRHGSTRWLNTDATLSAALDYVYNEQGEPMERHLYIAEADRIAKVGRATETGTSGVGALGSWNPDCKRGD